MSIGWLARRVIGATLGPHIPPDRRRAAVLLVDLQVDFLADDGRLPIARDQVDGLIAASNALARSGAEVVHVVNAFPPGAWFLNRLRRGAAIAGTAGAAIDPRIVPVDGAVVPKAQRDAFSNPALDARLAAGAIGRLIVAGVMAEACVRATVAGALLRGYDVTVAADAVGSRRARARAAALRSMARLGARVATAADAIAAAA
jgi:nicotinamidase-related amidase